MTTAVPRADWLRTTLEFLADEPEGVPPGDVVARLIEHGPPARDQGRAGLMFRRDAAALLRRGWVRRDDGEWFITDAGRQALRDHPDAARVHETATGAGPFDRNGGVA